VLFRSRDPRYIRIDGRPLFLIYRTELLPDPRRTAEIWRRRAIDAGIGDLYLARVESFATVPPDTIGFDAAVEFAPDWQSLPPPLYHRQRWDLRARLLNRLARVGIVKKAYLEHNIYPYELLPTIMLRKPPVPYRRFRCVTPGWDNSPRRASGATLFVDSTPEAYERWLRALVQDAIDTRHGDERIVFVNAWNEWAEGNHLEPDHRWGHAYLKATANTLSARVGALLPT